MGSWAEVPVPQNGSKPSVFEVSGVVKWFDTSKGYGFITPRDGLPDVMLVASCLRKSHFDRAPEGALIVVEVEEKEGRLKACRVVAIDTSTAIKPISKLSEDPSLSSSFQAGVVKSFDGDKGYGFINCDGISEDIYVGMGVLRKCNFSRCLLRHERILVRFGRRPKGLVALEVRSVTEI